MFILEQEISRGELIWKGPFSSMTDPFFLSPKIVGIPRFHCTCFKLNLASNGNWHINICENSTISSTGKNIKPNNISIRQGRLLFRLEFQIRISIQFCLKNFLSTWKHQKLSIWFFFQLGWLKTASKTFKNFSKISTGIPVRNVCIAHCYFRIF